MEEADISKQQARSSGSGLTPLKIAVIYAIAGGIWIFFSDRLLDMLMLDAQYQENQVSGEYSEAMAI